MLLVFVNNRAMYHSIDSVHKFETLFLIPHHQLNVDVVTFCVPKWFVNSVNKPQNLN